jgi:hypothetical protein
MLMAAARATSSQPDRGFTLADLIDSANELLRNHSIQFNGRTTDSADYQSVAERIVRGRFGDMRRTGYFTTDPPHGTLRVRQYNVRNNVAARLDELLGATCLPPAPEVAGTLPCSANAWTAQEAQTHSMDMTSGGKNAKRS